MVQDNFYDTITGKKYYNRLKASDNLTMFLRHWIFNCIQNEASFLNADLDLFWIKWRIQNLCGPNINKNWKNYEKYFFKEPVIAT